MQSVVSDSSTGHDALACAIIVRCSVKFPLWQLYLWLGLSSAARYKYRATTPGPDTMKRAKCLSFSDAQNNWQATICPIMSGQDKLHACSPPLRQLCFMGWSGMGPRIELRRTDPGTSYHFALPRKGHNEHREERDSRPNETFVILGCADGKLRRAVNCLKISVLTL